MKISHKLENYLVYTGKFCFLDFETGYLTLSSTDIGIMYGKLTRVVLYYRIAEDSVYLDFCPVTSPINELLNYYSTYIDE